MPLKRKTRLKRIDAKRKLVIAAQRDLGKQFSKLERLKERLARRLAKLETKRAEMLGYSLTEDMITAKALVLLHQKQSLVGRVNEANANIGDSLRFRMPVGYTVKAADAG